MERPQHYRCRHCGSLFVHYGKQPSTQTTHASTTTPSSSARFGLVLGLGVMTLGIAAVVWRAVASAPEFSPPPVATTTPSASDHRVREANMAAMKEAARAQREAAARPEPMSESEPMSEPEPEPIRLEAYQPLSGCSCKADRDGDGKTEKIQLALKASAVGTWITSAGTSREIAYDFIVRSARGEPFRLPLDETTAPPKRQRGEVMDVGVGCERDRLLVAAASRVSAWSLRTESLEWTAELPAPYVKKGRRAPSNGPTIYCGRLPVRKGRVTVQLPGGTMALGTDDGAEPGQAKD